MADDYHKLRVIGSGTFGQVWLVLNRETVKPYVIKEVAVSGLTPQLRAQTLTEVEALGRCKHLNIIRYRDAFVHDGALHIVMEYAEGGDLHKRIKDQNGTLFKEEVILDWFVQICFALRYIHGLKILHRDLKSQNIFLTNDNLLKVGDFGIARILQNSNEHALTSIGTPYYLSPEICQQLPYDYKSDMWAAGCVLYELCCLRYPFDGADLGALVVAIMRGRHEAIPSNYGQLLRDLTSVLLRLHPERRPSAEQILCIPMMQTHVNNYVKRTSTIREHCTPSPVKQLKRHHDDGTSSPRRDRATPVPSGCCSPSNRKRMRCQSWMAPRVSALIDCVKPPSSADAQTKRKYPLTSKSPNTELFRRIIEKKLAKGNKKGHGSVIGETDVSPSRCTHSGTEKDSPEVGLREGEVISTPPTRLAHNGITYNVLPHVVQPEDEQMSVESVLDVKHDVSDRCRAHLAGVLMARYHQEDIDESSGTADNRHCQLADVCRQLYDNCPRVISDAIVNMRRLSCVLQRRLETTRFLDYYTAVKDAVVLGNTFDELMQGRKAEDDFVKSLPLLLQLVQLECMSRVFAKHPADVGVSR